MEEGKNNLALSKQSVFTSSGPGNLGYYIGAAVKLGGSVNDLAPGLYVAFVSKTGSSTSTFFNHDSVACLDKSQDACGGKTNPAFQVADFFRNTENHGNISSTLRID